MNLLQSTTVQVSIARQPQEVYAYIRNFANFPAWATAFCLGIHNSEDGQWVMETPEGLVSVRFAEANPFGVLDHDVCPVGSDESVWNPMRVLANGDGCEVIFTLFQRLGMSDEQFAHDAEMVQRDLQSLKRVLENAAQ